MIEIQCTSCHTRYRIDERVLPDDTPTFKCSRCGHVFNADPVPAKARKAAVASVESPPRASRQPRPSRPKQNDPSAATPAAPQHQETPQVEPAAEPGRPEPEHVSDELRFDEPHVQEFVQQEAAPHEERTHLPEFDEPHLRADHSENGNADGGPAPADADDPLNRPFADRNQKADTGDNLRFDFSDDRSRSVDEDEKDLEIESAADADIEMGEPESDRAEADWQVGDTTPEFERGFERDEGPGHRGPIVVAPEPIRQPPRAPVRRAPAPQFSDAHFAQAPDRSAGFVHGDIPDEVAYFESAGRVHSSGFFVGMFFFVAVVFLGASIFICTEPVASARFLSQAPRIGGYFTRPIVPAMLVAMREVTTDYRKLKDGQVALVVAGSAMNVGNRPLHLVEIGAEILDAGGHAVRRQSVYCGNELSAKMLGEMTPREIEFSQDLSPQKSFAIAPSGAAPFLMVFINPPQPAGQLRMTIARAIAAEDPVPAAATARR